MTTALGHTDFDSPRVGIIADYGNLTLAIASALVASGVRVTIIAENLKAFENQLKGVQLLPANAKNLLGEKGLFSHLVFVSSYYSYTSDTGNFAIRDTNLLALLTKLKSERTKSASLLPAVVSSDLAQTFFQVAESARQVEGKHLALFVDSLLTIKRPSVYEPVDILLQGLAVNTVNTNTENLLAPISEKAVSAFIMRSFFAFTFPKGEVYLKGSSFSVKKIISKLHKETSAVNTTPQNFVKFSNASETSIKTKFPLSKLQELAAYFAKQKALPIADTPKKASLFVKQAIPLVPAKVESVVLPKPQINVVPQKRIVIAKKPKVWVRRLGYVFLAGVVFLVFSFGLAGSFVFAGYKSFLQGDYKKTDSFMVLGASTLSMLGKPFGVLANIPVAGKPFVEIAKSFSLTERLIVDLSTILKNLEVVNQFAGSIFGNSPYDANTYTQPLALYLDEALRETQFIEAEAKDNYFLAAMLKNNDGQQKFDDLKLLLQEGKTLLEQIPSLLGAETTKRYLIVLQDTSQLRPSGGKLLSLTIVTFNAGRLTDSTTTSVASADAKLNGYVEAPLPITKYLNTPSWYLADSNWASDFRTNAEKAEWFIDKELSVAVDGVVALDTIFVGKLLATTGPIAIADKGVVISGDNLHSFLDDDSDNAAFLLRALVASFTNDNLAKDPKVANTIYTTLTNKHLQVFLHDNRAQGALANLGWDGSLGNTYCNLVNCSDSVSGVVEANLGANNANLYVQRKVALEVDIKDNLTTKKLVLTLMNNSPNRDLVYKTHIRALADEGATFQMASLRKGNSQISVPLEVTKVSGRTEGGIYLEVPPNEQAVITFNWSEKNNLDFSKNGYYNLTYRKQPGVEAFPLSLQLNFPVVVVANKGNTFLTRDENIGYNEDLTRDLVSRIYW